MDNAIVPCELTRLRAEVFALREMEAALRAAARDAQRKSVETVARLPIHRAIAARSRPIGLVTLETR